MTDLADRPRLDIGRVVSRTFKAVGANFVTFFVLVLIFSSIPAYVISYAFSFLTMPMVLRGDMSLATYGLLSYPVSIIATIPGYIAMGAVTHGAMVSFNAGRASLGDCIGTGIGRAVPLFLLGLVTGIVILIGLVLLIIPGVFLALVLCAAAPAMVVEKIGVGAAMKRSGDLTRNNRWAILGLFVIVVVVTMLISAVAAFLLIGAGGTNALVTAADPLSAGPIAIVGTVLANTLASVIALTGIASIYYELRTNKEGATSDELAKVFD